MVNKQCSRLQPLIDPAADHVLLIDIGGGLAMNWGTVVALGLAPLLLGVLPCVAMCALGMCMSGGSGKCSSKPGEKEKPDDV